MRGLIRSAWKRHVGLLLTLWFGALMPVFLALNPAVLVPTPFSGFGGSRSVALCTLVGLEIAALLAWLAAGGRSRVWDSFLAGILSTGFVVASYFAVPFGFLGIIFTLGGLFKLAPADFLLGILPLHTLPCAIVYGVQAHRARRSAATPRWTARRIFLFLLGLVLAPSVALAIAL